MPDVEAVIVGGGISGLSAAYELTRRGVSFRLFEGSERLGGVIRTDRIDGFTIDGGPDSLLAQKPAGMRLCEELGLGDRLIATLPPRTAYVVRSGRLHPLPTASILGVPTRLRSLAGLTLLSAAGRTRMALDLVLPARRTTTDESVGAFFRRRFGSEACTYIADPLLAGIHAGDVERLSMAALFPRLAEAERRHGSVIRHYRSTREETDESTGGLFRSLPGGIGELVAALKAALPAGHLLTRHAVSAIDGRGPYRVTCASGTETTARKVVLATPPRVTAGLVAPTAADLAALCTGIPCTSTATVVVAYAARDVRQRLSGSGFVVPRAEPGPLMAGSWVSSKWPGRAPADCVLLRGFLGGVRDPRAVDRSDKALVEVVHRAFAAMLDISSPPVTHRVYRWRELNPQLEVGHLDRIAAIDAELTRLPGLHLVGAGFRGVGISDCIAAGRAAARLIASRS